MAGRYSLPFTIKWPMGLSFITFRDKGFDWQVRMLFWVSKKTVLYQDIRQVEMVKGPLLPLTLPQYNLRIIGYNSSKPLLQLNLTASGSELRAILLDAIATHASQATLNNLAIDIRNNYFG